MEKSFFSFLINFLFWLSIFFGRSVSNDGNESIRTRTYLALRNDINFLKTNLNDSSSIRCGSIQKLNGTLEKLIPNLLRHQHETCITDATAFADLLRRKLIDSRDTFGEDSGRISALLRTFIDVNRILTEVGYLYPTRRRVEPCLFNNVSKTRHENKTTTDQIISNTTSLLQTDSVCKDWKEIQLKSGSTKWKPTLVLQKYCLSVDGENSTEQWRILIALRLNLSRTDISPPVFYVTLPLNSIDLNQCDDSTSHDLRSTHGCPNLTTSCVFVAGGGFELGNYECCCQAKNASSGWPKNRQLHRMLLQKYEQCTNGRSVEEARTDGRAFPGRCSDYFASDYALRRVLLAINILCALTTFALIFVVTTQRKVKDWGARGWALMEFFLVGAILLYCIVILEYFQPSTSSCCLIPWCRELGFALFYGAVVLKIHRNLFEHGVRKANYVFIKEKDLLKYLLCIVAFTLVGLLAWTVTAMQAASTPIDSPSSNLVSAVIGSGRAQSGDIYMVCTFFHWNLIWHTLEFGFLSYGAYLSYKARTTTWNEKRQFSGAVALEMVVSLNMIIIKKHIWLDSSPDTLLLLSFIHAHATVTVVVVSIMATKLYYARLAPTARDHSTASSGANRMHPSLAKLRDNLMNGTVDIADMPIGDLNPEDIRAELKRVYTQLRMYKLTNLYMDNPHISKRKGGKKISNKQTNRRISIPTVPSKTSHKELTRQANVVETDERSSLTKAAIDEEAASTGSITDLTIQTSPHNVYYSKSKPVTSSTAASTSNRLRLDSELSVCI